MTHLIVFAKAPTPGRVKTRLCPPCTPEQAAAIAAASLEDTLDTAAAADVTRRVLAIDGEPGAWLRPGFDVVRQRGIDLAERMTNAFVDCISGADDAAVLVVGDSPQMTAAQIEAACNHLGDVDAVLGLAEDGGYWLMGVRGLRGDLTAGVTMSTGTTGRCQYERLRTLGYEVRLVDVLRDVDDAEDAQAIADLVPGSRFAAAVRCHLPTVDAT